MRIEYPVSRPLNNTCSTAFILVDFIDDNKL